MPLLEWSPKPSEKLSLTVCPSCPPEDIRGLYGFFVFLEGLAVPKHEQLAEMLEMGDDFAPETFDATQATREM